MANNTTPAANRAAIERVARCKAIKEFTEALEAGLLDCAMVVHPDTWEAGYKTTEVKSLIARIASELKNKV